MDANASGKQRIQNSENEFPEDLDHIDTRAQVDDYTSFPTIPDPANEHSQALSNIFSKTFQKVASNASHLVYPLAQESTKREDQSHRNASGSITPTGGASRAEVTSSINDEPVEGELANQSSGNKDGSSKSVASDNSQDEVDFGKNDGDNVEKSATKDNHAVVNHTRESQPGRIVTDSGSSSNGEPKNFTASKMLLPASHHISLNSMPTKSVNNVCAVSSTDDKQILKKHDLTGGSPSVVLLPKKGGQNSNAKTPRQASHTSLQRISSIFTNLPNDFELSDDSLSEVETSNRLTISVAPSKADSCVSTLTGTPKRKRSVGVLNMRKLRGNNENFKNKHEKRAKAVLAKTKDTINNNISGPVSSASSLITSTPTKGEKKHRKRSENPLNSGGLPKKFWMNDSFVSDCLNCFKPFTPFRRKHHCRFCGQIFCAECTLFISLNNHKKRGRLTEIRGSPSNKLRVCKPCYSDVIVYLSDNFSSSSEDEEEVSETNLSNFRRNRSLSSGSSQQTNALEGRSEVVYDGNSEARSVRMSQKQAPQMAILTTRKGEAVEIAASNNKFNNTFAPGSPLLYNNKMSDEDVSVQRLNGDHSNLLNRLSPTASVSGSGKTFNSILSLGNKGVYNKTEEPFRSYKKKMENDMHGSVVTDNWDADRDIYEGDESENEDENAMLLYTSLNHLDYNNSSKTTPLPASSQASSAPPDIKNPYEYSSMNSKLLSLLETNPGSGGPIIQNSIVANKPTSNLYLEDRPTHDSLRSHERAYASLLRMKSKRKNKSLRNLPALTGNTKFSNGENGNSSSSLSVPYNGNIGYAQILPSTPGGVHSSTISFPRYQQESSSYRKYPLTHLLPKEHSWNNSCDTVEDDIEQVDLTLRSRNFDPGQSSADFDSDSLKNRFKLYKEYLNDMIKQCLDDAGVKQDQALWRKVLNKLFKEVDKIQLTDTLDIRQYIKIKKILGGCIESSGIVDGMFITKTVDSRRMASNINNPKIALLMFPLEYLKQKQFVSLRMVRSQESVYITNLVSRLASLGADVIVVGDSVCGLAEKQLKDNNITVISNTKPQVIERISRYTGASIYQSINDLFFKKGKLGTCEKFEVKNFLYKDVVKTFLFFSGGDVSAGFTICLRGGELETLERVKSVVETMLASVLNSKFEAMFFEDSYVLMKNGTENSSAVTSLSQELQKIKEDLGDLCLPSGEKLVDDDNIINFIKFFGSRKISSSPCVCLTLPHAFKCAIESIKEFLARRDKNDVLRTLESVDDFVLRAYNDLHLGIEVAGLPNKDSDVLSILKYASDLNLKSVLNECQLRIKNWNNCVNLKSYQLDPEFHRRIHFLHSTVSMKYATPCLGPSIVVIDYYTDNDKCLGLFLDQIFHESSNDCLECGELLMDHYMSYVHDNSKINIIIEKFSSFPKIGDEQLKNQHLMWSTCSKCNISSPITPMSSNTYYLSVGQFFELCFWGRNVSLMSTGCQHDYFRDHIRYFSYNDMVLRIEPSQVDLFEVIVPRKQLEYYPEIDIKLKVEAFNDIREKIKCFFKSVVSRLAKIRIEILEQAEKDRSTLDNLFLRSKEQEASLQAKAFSIYNSTSSTTTLPLNTILRDLQELGVSWDNEIHTFEPDYVPSENDITKITQSHLKKFLDEKLNSEDKADKERRLVRYESTPECNDVRKETTLSNRYTDRDGKADSDASQDVGVVEDKNEELGKADSSSMFKKTNIIDKISRMEALLERESSGMDPRSVKNTSEGRPPVDRKPTELSLHTKRDTEIPQNRVSQLAHFFDQMNFDQISLEFEKQREEELKKRKNKFRMMPIVPSKPIVEIFNKIEDVVDVNDEYDSRKRDNKANTGKEMRKGEERTLQPRTDKQVSNRESEIVEGSHVNKTEESEREKALKYRFGENQPERSSLLKTLTNLWADRSATLWDPLYYPLEPQEHTFADSDIIVREDEPSSLISFCLSTNDYKQKIKVMAQDRVHDTAEINEYSNKKFNSFAKIEKKFKTKNENGLNVLEDAMVKNSYTHLKYQYLDGNTNLSCKIFYAEQFDAFRKACGNNENFVQSLARCVKWNSKGGKSGSNFLKTLDDRYILKELSKSELESFVSIAPFYFKYISQSIFHTLTSAIAKIFGFFQIQIKNTITGKTNKMDFLIMENLFYNHNTTRIFDLKGSMRNRHVKQTGKENEVLLDENMIEFIYESPVFVKEHLKKLLRGSLFNDTSFLSAMDVMDYSLIIGIDDVSNRLYVGIIDWLRTFTWDKKVENWVKGNNLIGGGKKGKDPTIVTPKQYRTRFREAMERYILEVPDYWYVNK